MSSSYDESLSPDEWDELRDLTIAVVETVTGTAPGAASPNDARRLRELINLIFLHHDPDWH